LGFLPKHHTPIKALILCWFFINSKAENIDVYNDIVEWFAQWHNFSISQEVCPVNLHSLKSLSNRLCRLIGCPQLLIHCMKQPEWQDVIFAKSYSNGNTAEIIFITCKHFLFTIYFSLRFSCYVVFSHFIVLARDLVWTQEYPHSVYVF